jgi:hypothetical protein
LTAKNSSQVKRPGDVKGAVARAIAKNVAMGVPLIREARVRAGRTAATGPSPAGLDQYAYNLLNELLTHTGPLAGKSVLEIGPGDNVLAGLAMLAAGARAYTALDRFPGPYASAVARDWYRLLRENWPTRHPGMPWPADLDAASFPDDPRVQFIHKGVEDIQAIEPHDVVCSYVVGEHVLSPDAFARCTRRAIGTHGVGLHCIDFSGHDWDAHGDPFLFLKFSDRLWNWMGSNRGVPNRVRFDDYVACFERNDLRVEVVDRRVVSYDPRDHWVRDRASEGFLTHWAVFKLTAR